MKATDIAPSNRRLDQPHAEPSNRRPDSGLIVRPPNNRSLNLTRSPPLYGPGPPSFRLKATAQLHPWNGQASNSLNGSNLLSQCNIQPSNSSHSGNRQAQPSPAVHCNTNQCI
ncbi:hypothetical protein ACFE04_008107 [Oxalis oulophora]